jgi:hypothetical protein
VSEIASRNRASFGSRKDGALLREPVPFFFRDYPNHRRLREGVIRAVLRLLPPAAPTSDLECHDRFFALGLVYLALPCILFLAFFVRVWLGLPFALALSILTWRFASRIRLETSTAFWLAAGFAAALAVVVGIPTGQSAWDWIKHWALLNELASNNWPVEIDLQGEERHLRFYLAAYLVPALASKMLHVPVLVPATCWFVLGYYMVVRTAGFAHEQRSFPIVAGAMLLVILLAGGDAVASHAINAILGRDASPWLGLHYEHWYGGQPFQFASALTHLAWVPHQSIPVYIVAGMIVLDRGTYSLARTGLAYCLLALWSPFGMIGLLPLMLLRTLPYGRLAFTWPVGGAILVGCGFAALTTAYLATDLPAGNLCLTCLPARLAESDHLLVFLVVELVPFALLLRSRIVRDPVCATAFATLLVIPLFRGETIDFMARGSMGPLFVLALCAAGHILDVEFQWRKSILGALALLLCLPTTMSELFYHAEKGAAHREADAMLPPDRRWLSVFSTSSGITVAEFLRSGGWRYEAQYFSAKRPTILREAK